MKQILTFDLPTLNDKNLLDDRKDKIETTVLFGFIVRLCQENNN